MVQFLLDKNAEPLSEICCASIITMSMNVNDDMSQNVPQAEVSGILELGNVWFFVQLIHRPMRTKNQLYKNPNIA